MQQSFFLANEEATESLASQIAKRCTQHTVVYLSGDLGAGKTSFSRGFIRGLGFDGRVKSPTYTLVEPYEISNWRVFHFDLYRLADPEELEFMGIRDYFEPDCLCLVEWPDKGAQLLASADLAINIEFEDQGRRITLQALTQNGRHLINELQA